MGPQCAGWNQFNCQVIPTVIVKLKVIKQRREVEVGLTLRSSLRLGMRLNALEWLLRADVVDTRLIPFTRRSSVRESCCRGRPAVAASGFWFDQG